MTNLELEKTYLAKYLPKDLQSFPHKEILDIYIPKNAIHPILRVRKNGDKYEITKKIMEGNDLSELTEHTIIITKEEYDSLSVLDSKKVRKIRFYYQKDGVNYEFDIFQDDLKGLVLVDVEFENSDVKKSFKMPEFCLADVTEDESMAGGMLCGKKYEDLSAILVKYNYGAINL